MRTATLLLSLLLIASTGCNGSDLTSVGGPLDDGPTAGGDPDEGINPDDPHNGGEGEDEIPQTVPTTDDTDGDGIPNDDDFIPCQAFYVKIWNQEVSSAEVNLNEQMIVDSNFFPTEEVIVEFINPVPGINYIDFGGKVAGSPEDELHTEIWSVSPAWIWFHETIIRGNGQPEEATGTFDVNVTC